MKRISLRSLFSGQYRFAAVLVAVMVAAVSFGVTGLGSVGSERPATVVAALPAAAPALDARQADDTASRSSQRGFCPGMPDGECLPRLVTLTTPEPPSQPVQPPAPPKKKPAATKPTVPAKKVDSGGGGDQCPAVNVKLPANVVAAVHARVSGCDAAMWLWIISKESGGNVHATNSTSGAYGVGQALPGSKMAPFGADWRDNVVTQLKWMLSYMQQRYKSIAGAYNYWVGHHWY